MTNTELKERLIDTIALLSVPGVGKGRFHKLVKQFGSPSAALSAPVYDLEATPGISHTIAAAIRSSADREPARATYARIVQLGWNILYPEHPEYPKSLLNIHDMPPLLFRMGQAAQPEEKMIAIVGTRHASEKGRQFAYNLAVDLTHSGITVVSGMAEGIDAAAHLGALEAGGRTVAVWGTPLNVIYPPIHRPLADKIVNQGAIYSEYLPEDNSDPGHFPERNRIISGLSEGIVVIEAGKKSGALITAKLALDQGKELFAVPGWPDAGTSLGTNELIKRGAKLLTSVADIFDELPCLKGEITAHKFQSLPELTETEKGIVTVLSSGPMQIDNLSRTSGLAIPDLLELLLALELKGIVEELSGKRFTLTD